MAGGERWPDGCQRWPGLPGGLPGSLSGRLLFLFFFDLIVSTGKCLELLESDSSLALLCSQLFQSLSIARQIPLIPNSSPQIRLLPEYEIELTRLHIDLLLPS